MERGLALDEERAARSVMVKDIPLGISMQDIMIHFQRARNGGGEVESVTMEKQSAVITFDEQKVARSVLKTMQVLKGSVLLLEHYQQVDCSEPEVFGRVTAELNGYVQQISSKELSLILDNIKAKTNIGWHEDRFGFVMSGSFTEILHARRYLQEAIQQRPAIPQPSISSERSAKSSTELSDAPRSSTVDHREHEGSTFPDKGQGDHSTAMYDTDSMFEKYLCRFYKGPLMSIGQKLQITWDKKSSQVILTPQPHGTKEEFLAGNDEFVSLYQNVHKTMNSKRFTFQTSGGSERDMISRISEEFSVIFERCEDRVQWIMYGEEEKVAAALTELEQTCPIKPGAPSKPTKDGGSRGVEDHTDTSKTENGAERSTLEATLAGNIKISVYQGDIAEEHVDAIVNATNRYLSHDVGVASAIRRKGGPTIDQEYNDICKRKGELKVGDTIRTGSGNLSCDCVIHAVGPDWQKEGTQKSRKMLKRACMNCLSAAEEAEAESIALPAISSGMPKDVCAKVMFDAVQNYSKTSKPKQGFGVTDIRFVNIDDATVKVFRDEFSRRFGPPLDIHIKSTSTFEGNSKGSEDPREKKEVTTAEKNKIRSKTGSSGAGKSSEKSRKSVGGHGNHLHHQYARTGDLSTVAKPAPQESAPKSTGSAAYVEHPLAAMSSSKNMKEDRDDECAICLDTIKEPTFLKTCKHEFCKACIDEALIHNNRCPVCTIPCGPTKGNQPRDGTMHVRCDRHCHLPGYDRYNTIIIDYHIPYGIQSEKHPNPGQYYNGTSRTAYLPDSPEGRHVLELLKRAFDAGLMFTVGTSVTTGLANQVTWNDIHHKTSKYGGSSGFGYPDPNYLKRVKEELAAKGIQ